MEAKTKKNRKNLERKYGEYYEFKSFGNRLLCAYCMDIRESVDHIPPLSVVDQIGMDRIHEEEIDLITVPCCQACNSKLSNRRIATYEERLMFLYNNLLDKAESRPFWSDDELDSLGGELKRLITAKQLRTHREITMRLRGMETAIGRCDIKGH